MCWDEVELAMWGFPKQFCMFVTKQVSKFAGTNRQLSRFDESIENVCPSCGTNDESIKQLWAARHATPFSGMNEMIFDSAGFN